MLQASPDFLRILEFVLVFGLPATLFLTFSGLVIGFFLGVLLALARVYGNKPLQVIAEGYEKVLRGIPLLVLMVLFGIGLAFLFTWVGRGLPAAFAAAIFALGIRSAAYQSQIFRGAILSVSEGQLLAARSIGMSQLQATRHIVLPQAFRLSLPSWANEYAVVIKDSSLALVLGIPELVKVAFDFTSPNPALFFLTMIVLTLIYFCFTYPVTRFLGEFMSKRLKNLGLGGGQF